MGSPSPLSYGRMSPPRSLRVAIAFYSMVRCLRHCHWIILHISPPDLYGRGYSEAPMSPYNTNLYTTQLAFLMQYLKWEKANIVGLSMGGAIAASFTSQFPHLVDEGVGLIASAGLMEVCAIASFQYHSTNRSSRVTSHAHLNLCPPRSSRRWHPRGRSRYVCTRP